MFQILTVCTGNICRSPLAAMILRTRLSDLDPAVTSAGTRGLAGAPMTPEAQRLAAELGVAGVAGADAAAHRSRYLTEEHLSVPDLILTMTRDHRRHVVELAPARMRSTFTVREFARLAGDLSDDGLRAAASATGSEADAVTALRAAVRAVAARRGIADPPAAPEDDDVIDPYRRPWATYLLSAQQMAPGLAEVERVVRAASSRRPR
ncbi:low molecular weight phosphatase family protein [Microbacterium sp.]|uniref:arsenate reductase/protein-tyrosine-phosphatase family protein n=1 Tax=Microbacterium sp. TaxID=51671 RepID=UPI0025D19E52|nr:low molecular weight phosphatase family protein [Microbacterium sp.]